MNSIRQPFFALLRAGLWSSSVDTRLFSGSVDWNSIVTFAMQQTVSAVLSEGILRLPEAYRPDAVMMRHLHTLAICNIRQHALINRTLARMLQQFRSCGIHPVLLKGQGVASNYPDPTRRWCGDIDLYIGKKDYADACVLARQWCEQDERVSESRKHFHFHHNGVIVELHRIAEQLPTPWHNARFQQWTQRQLQGKEHTRREIELEGTCVTLPPVNFDALYIFNHAWHHFSAGNGVGLRQLCDWARYLHTFRNEIDRAQLERDLRSFGLWRIWQVFGYMAVDVLGLPPEEYPFYTRRYAAQGAKILEMIEVGGNFGFFDPSRRARPLGYTKGKLHTLCERQRYLCKLLPLFPKQVIAAWGMFLYHGMKQLVVDQIGGMSVASCVRKSKGKRK